MKALILAALVSSTAIADIKVIDTYHGDASAFAGTPEMLIGKTITFTNASGTTDFWTRFVDGVNILPTSLGKYRDEVFLLKWKDSENRKKKTSFELNTCADTKKCDFVVDDFLVDMINEYEGIAFYKHYKRNKMIYFSVK